MTNIASNFLMIEMPGGGEMIIILVVVLLLFGGKKIPELMRGLGKGIREFNDAKGHVTRELEEGMKTPDPTTTTTTTAASTINGTVQPSSTSTSPTATTSHTSPSAN